MYNIRSLSVVSFDFSPETVCREFSWKVVSVVLAACADGWCFVCLKSIPGASFLRLFADHSGSIVRLKCECEV